MEENLSDLERVNRYLGGVAPVARELERIGAQTALDVGCGGADIPRALVRRARDRGRRLTVTCLDQSDQILMLAARKSAGEDALSFVRGDARALPFADRSFDVAIFSLSLHHLEPPDAAIVLRELRRVARLAPIVCDLRRSRLAYAATWAYMHIASRNRLMRHDGPLSVLRAYTPLELRALAAEAGWKAPRIRCDRWFRMTAVDADADAG